MSELQVTYNGRRYSFQPGATVRVGRSSDNDVIIEDPTVSRRHSELTWESTGWVWQNSGQAATFLSGQPAVRFGVSQAVEVSLASPQGPVLLLESAAAGQQPMRTELASRGGLPAEAVAPATNVGNVPAGYDAAAQAGYGGPAQAGYPGAAQPGYQGAAQPGYPGQAQPGYPGAAQPGAVPPGMPGFPPGYQGGPGYPGGPGMPAAQQLDMGSALQILIPVRSWLHDAGWRQGLRLLIIPYALLPIIFLGVFGNYNSLETPGWAYSLYIAPLWLLSFWWLIRPPERIGWQEVQIAIGIVIWVVIWIHIVTININDQLGASLNFPKALVVGYNEETTKAIPVLVAAMVLLKVRKKKLDPRMWMLMGTVAGLTFGIVEQSIYTPAAIVGIHSAQAASQAVGDTLLFAFRVFVDGFQHAVWAGISGFFVGMAVNYRRRRIPLLLLGVSIPAILHALNDWTLTIFSTVWVAVIVQLVSLLLFLGYTLSAATIDREVRRNPQFRGQSMLMERFSQPGQSPGT
jgi:RsiW-degrading membrane proteinase PrsW (M82 family)